MANVNSFEEIIDLLEKGDLSKINIRICDRTDEKIDTLPYDLTLSNFGNLEEEATPSDIVLGVVHMVFEVVGMMTAFASKNDTIRDVVLIGSITTIPNVKGILKRIEQLHNITFTIPENPQYAVVLGAVRSRIRNKVKENL